MAKQLVNASVKNGKTQPQMANQWPHHWPNHGQQCPTTAQSMANALQTTDRQGSNNAQPCSHVLKHDQNQVLYLPSPQLMIG